MIRIATVETEKAERLMKALCNHFARKTTAGYEGNQGHIQFRDGRCDLTATASTLTLQLEADNLESLARVERVAVDHLLRFAADEDLQISRQDMV